MLKEEKEKDGTAKKDELSKPDEKASPSKKAPHALAQKASVNKLAETQKKPTHGQSLIDTMNFDVETEKLQQEAEAPPASVANVQSEAEMKLDSEVEVQAKTKGDPNKILTEKLTRGLKNPIKDIETKLAK